MLKKLLFIMVITGLLLLNRGVFNRFIAASSSMSTLIISCGVEANLEIEGYEISYSNVNYKQAGIYFVKYMSLVTNEEVIRTVKVVNNEELLTNGILQIEKKSFIKLPNYTIIKTIIIPNGYVSLCSDEEYFYLVIEINNKVNTSKVIAKEKCEIADLCYDEKSNLIFCYGHYFNQRLIDIYLCSYRLDGKIEMMTVTGGRKQDIISDFLVLEDVIILGGNTCSTDGIFEHSGSAEDSFVAVYDKKSGDFIKYFNLGLDGIDYISKMVFLDCLYVVLHYYYDGVAMMKIVKINLEDGTKSEIHINHFQLVTSVALKTDGNQIYFLCQSYNEKEQKTIDYLYAITTKLQIILLDEYASVGYKPADLCVEFDHLMITYYNSATAGIRVIGTDEKMINVNESLIEQSYVIGDKLYIINSNQELIVYQLLHLSFKKMDNFNRLFYRHQLVDIDKEQSSCNYNPKIFGDYEAINYYYVNDLIIIFYEQLQVSAEFNISNYNTYQKGITLEFNADGYLNGEKINSGTVIDCVGTYYLELVGYKNNSKYYQIEVIDLDYEQPIIKSILIEKEKYNIEESSQVIINQHLTKNLAVKDDVSHELWYIIIPLVILISSLFWYFYFKEVKKCFN